jgi:hypothetical protein
MNLYNKKKTADDDVEDEGDVLLDINLYLKRAALLNILGRFKSRVQVERMLVQTDLGIECCRMENNVCTVMMVHMDRYEWLMEGLLNVCFRDSVFHPTSLSLQIKSSKFHSRSSSDLFRTSDPWYDISFPQLH